MNWASQWAFFLFLPLGLILFWLYYKRKSRQSFILFSSKELINHGKVAFRSYLRHLPLVLKILGISFAIIALARPQVVSNKEIKNAEGIDIMVALDISDSMLIEDMEPTNRMEAAKKTIHDFISGRISDRIGLVVFAGESYTRVPLTLDYPLLTKNLMTVETVGELKMGTAIGVALANAAARLKDTAAKSKVIILLTDGENNSGTIAPETALEIAKGFDMKIYTIGIGRDGMAKLPVYTNDVFGRRVKTYQPMHSKVNEDLLKKLANETGGKYFRANNSMSLKGVFNEIDRLEKTEVEITQYTRYDEVFERYLIWALVFYAMSYLLSRTLLRRRP